MGYQDIFTMVANAIQQALNNGNKTTMFLGTGLSLWGIFASVIIVFFGAEWMFAPHTMNASRVFRLAIQLLICKTVLTFYVVPIHGYSFTGVITQEANYITDQIGHANYDLMTKAATDLEFVIPAGSITDIHNGVVGALVVIFIEAIKGLCFVMASFGFIVQAILLLLGPLFIPFFIVPQLDFLAWNWFKAFLQYSFYAVMANAYAYIYTIVCTAAFQQIQNFILQPDHNAATCIGGLLTLMALGLFGTFMLPSIVGHLFSGQSGASPGSAAAGTAVAAAGTAVKAAI